MIIVFFSMLSKLSRKGSNTYKIQISKETTWVLSATITKITEVHHMKGQDILDNSQQDSIALDFTI